MAKGKIIINEKWCKGCEICVELCPTDAIEMRDFKVAIKDEDKCIACMQCELRCPDFAIEIEKIG
jgi:2-oxoglutarate ferredoxin oxidoreductase subunit delta